MGPGTAGSLLIFVKLPYSEACERNKRPIGEVLERILPKSASVLEIGAGTGQHAVYFTRLLPGIRWQASDVGPHLPDLERRFEQEGDDRLPAPIELDVADSSQWPDGQFDAVYTANTLHIMPWELTPLFMAGAAACLRPGGQLIVYGPFHDRGQHTAPSNEAFDRSLRQRDPAMGIRDAVEVAEIAARCGLAQRDDLGLPANNRILAFTRSKPSP